MNGLEKSELVFLTKLDLQIELTAIQRLDELEKRYWELHIKAINNGFVQEAIFYSARGKIRKFYQLNALYDICNEIFKNKCKSIQVLLSGV